MTSVVIHIVLVLLGLCVVFILQAQLPFDGSIAAILTLATVPISGIVSAFVGASVTRRYGIFWIMAPAASYAAGLVALVTPATFSSGVVAVASAIAVILMAGTAWLAVRAAFLIHEVDEMGALLLFEGRLKSVNSPDDYRLCGEKLLAQCHRFYRPLAVIAVEWQFSEPSGNETDRGITARLATHFRRRELIAGINDTLRTTDLMLFSDRPNCCFLVCPDTDLASALQFCARLDAAIAGRLSGTVTFGLAHFGEAGYSLEELLAAAADRLSKPAPREVTQPASEHLASEHSPTVPKMVPSLEKNWVRDSGGELTARRVG